MPCSRRWLALIAGDDLWRTARSPRLPELAKAEGVNEVLCLPNVSVDATCARGRERDPEWRTQVEPYAQDNLEAPPNSMG